MAQVWLITGSARGLGRAIAEAVLAAGDKLIATARNPQQLSDLVERYGDHVRAVALDVTDERAAIAAVQLAIDVFGRLDVLVNNAGYGNLAAIEDTTIQDFRAQIETNLFGVVNLTKAAIPVMRRQGAGRILQFSSVGGRVGPIGRGAYAAAKWGVEGFSEVLAKEVGPLGIKVTIIEPGGFRTDFAGSSQTILADNLAYASTVGAVARFQRAYDGAQPGDPKKAAAAVLNIARLDEPPMRLLLGRDAVRAAAEADRMRAEADRKWRSLSESTDFIDDAGQTSNPASPSSSTGGRADLKSRTWLITGASSGLGYALAEFVLQRGDRVVLAAIDGQHARPRRALPRHGTRGGVGRDRAKTAARRGRARGSALRRDRCARQQRRHRFSRGHRGAARRRLSRPVRGQLLRRRRDGPSRPARHASPAIRDDREHLVDGRDREPAVNGFYASSKFALEGMTEALWQELEPIGLRAFLVEPGSFRTGIEQRTRFSGEPIEAYEATSGAFRKMMTTVSPDMFPGDPVRAAAAIYDAVTSESPRHWVVLGSDAQRRIGAKLDMLRTEFEAGADTARSTDYPGSAKAIL
jgi:NAD(P)-dependent dehydrogenase (short-subunit alcohol dehydrogenase family)